MRSLVQIQLGPLLPAPAPKVIDVKKILALVAAAGAAILVLLKVKNRPGEDPWHEATK